MAVFPDIHRPEEAIALQRNLAQMIICSNQFGDVRLIAGVDVSFPGVGARFSRRLPRTSDRDRPEVGRAAIAVLRFPDLTLVESVTAEEPVSFPYVPGLLSFREIPVILSALRKVTVRPDLLMVDGQGRAHPRRLGIASHLGLVTGFPAIGCAKSRLTGRAEEPADEPGAWQPLEDRGEVIGAVVRTKRRTKPLYVSIGHRIDLETAISLVLRCTAGYRLPEPTRQAHLAAGRGRYGGSTSRRLHAAG